MNLKYLIIVLLISLLIFEGCSQRGGRRSRSRSSRSSWGRSSSRRSGTGTKTTAPLEAGLYWVLGVIATGISFFFPGKRPSGENRDREIRKVTDEFERVNEYRSDLNENERSNFIDRFMQTNWKVEIKVGSSPTVYSWDFKMKNLTKRTDFVYEIEAEGYNDENGNSTIKGIILFRESSMSICFDKLHNDRGRAGQTGKWDLLIYEGHMNDDHFEGGWYYQGFKNDGEYSGKMKMMPKRGQ